MNLVYAEVASVCSANGARLGKVRVRGALSTVPLHLVPEAQPGDTVLICDGVAIGKVHEESEQSSILGGNNVSGYSR
jgi:hydrogenase maturation factor